MMESLATTASVSLLKIDLKNWDAAEPSMVLQFSSRADRFHLSLPRFRHV
jgi:hypothetical protein